MEQLNISLSIEMDDIAALTSRLGCRASCSERWFLAERQSHLVLSGGFLLICLPEQSAWPDSERLSERSDGGC